MGNAEQERFPGHVGFQGGIRIHPGTQDGGGGNGDGPGVQGGIFRGQGAVGGIIDAVSRLSGKGHRQHLTIVIHAPGHGAHRRSGLPVVIGPHVFRQRRGRGEIIAPAVAPRQPPVGNVGILLGNEHPVKQRALRRGKTQGVPSVGAQPKGHVQNRTLDLVQPRKKDTQIAPRGNYRTLGKSIFPGLAGIVRNAAARQIHFLRRGVV